MNADPARPDFYFVAGLLCLDLVNTEPAAQGQRVELLASPGDLARWLRAAPPTPGESARRTATRWEAGPHAQQVLREALELRRALRTVAEGLVGGNPVGSRAVADINRVLASQRSYPRLIRQGDRYVVQHHAVEASPLVVLAPVANSAAWLLEHGDASLVRRCEGRGCVLFFYDSTRNRSRRWCSMDACGGRAKALAYYHRARGRAT